MQILAAPFLSAVAGDFESIATTTVGAGGTGTITFSSIPSTFKHLQIRAIGRSSNTSSTADNLSVSVNSDTTFTNYYSHWLSGDGSTPGFGSFQGSGYNAYVGDLRNSSSSNTQIYSVIVLDILDYADSNKFKTFRLLNGRDQNGAGQVWLGSSLWKSTSAITSLSFSIIGSFNFAEYSSFALYGIKG
jgi:hypothetical protein